MRPTGKLTTVAVAAMLMLTVFGSGAVGAASSGGQHSVDASQAQGVEWAPASSAFLADNNTTDTENETDDGNETDSVNETEDGNETENETDNRSENASDAFGLQVSSFVHELLSSENTTNESIGQQVSAFVTANNPGADKRPDHAGPDGNKTQGPPEDKGPDASDKGAQANGGSGDKGGGPPDHAKGR